MEYNEYEENQEKKTRSKYLSAVLIVITVILLIVTAVLVTLGVKESRYHSALKKANQFFTSGAYQDAIVEYENAIAIDKKNQSAYLNLASAYINLGDYTSALNAVEQGMLLISSEKLSNKKIEIQNLIGSGTTVVEDVMTQTEIDSYSAEAALENTAFDMVAEYTYTDYFRDYGSVSGQREGSKVVLDYTSGGFGTVYYDTAEEKVLDNQNGMPYAAVKPREVSFDNLKSIFYVKGEKFAVSYKNLEELFGSTLTFDQDVENDRYYMTAEYKNCRISVETDVLGNIISEYAWNKVEPIYRNAFESGNEVDGEVKGYIQDATTGKGMKATLKVRSKGKKAGAVIEELYSKNDGSYIFGGEKGSYTIEVSAKGYITEYLDVSIEKDQVKTGENVVLSPEVGEGEIRIVLTWGSRPLDLDSYAIGKSSSGKSFAISFRNTSVADVGNLDVDDRNGYGPETITITDTGASFEYSVVDFLAEGTLGGSDATVKVYLPGKSSAMEFKVPQGEGLLWTVFKYENGEIKTINRLDSENLSHSRK